MHAQESHILLTPLGDGSFSVVYEAYDVQKQRRVAVKKVAHRNDGPSVYNEIKANEVVKGIRGIAPLLGHYTTKDATCLIFEKVQGVDLFGMMEGRDFCPLPESVVLSIMSSVASILSSCHSRGVAHRDVKLENIMIDRNGRVYLIDFGLASFFRLSNGRETSSTDFCGSVEYMPPECVYEMNVKATATDAWALGITLYALLFGCFPYSKEEMPEVFSTQHHVPLPDHAKVSEDMRFRLESLLCINPKNRASIDIML
ncbi:kinase [Planoprotostelium fungivorum]|uniref:Kinase n=1 Tax=Planoprotostelium fungivorum TaxID=1890364 RepID=A0A2P6NZB0_9EUKA|nr:kinase [Planoprotostelium fungivorum]